MEGIDQPMGPMAPIADYKGTARARDTSGNKDDVAATGAGASEIALLKYLIALIQTMDIDLAYRMATEFPEWCVEDDKVVFAIGMVDTSNGNPIPVANITAGTVDIIRLRAGASTSIIAGQVLTKKDGLLYCVIDTDTVNWQLDDQIKVEQATASSFDIGVDTYNVAFAPQLCHIADLGTVYDDIQAILIDTNELQTDWTNGGRLDLILDAILADTNELQTDWTTGGRLDLILGQLAADVAAILVDLTNIEAKIDIIDTNVDSIETIVTDIYKGMINGPGFSPVHAVIDDEMTFQVPILDLIEDFPSGAEITSKGTCTIYRYRPGAASALILNSSACASGTKGDVYYTYTWVNALWQKGDIAEVWFEGIVVTKNGKTYDLPKYEVFVPIGIAEMLSEWDAHKDLLVTDDAKLDSIEAKVDIIDGNVDDIETLLGVVDGKIDTIDTNVDSILEDTANMNKGMINGSGFSSVYAVIDKDITVQIQIGDLIEDYPAVGEITSAGTVTIIRIRPGAATVSVVNSQACTAGNNGEVGYTYGWPNASWQKGDVAEITFSGIVITKNAKTFDLPDYDVFLPIGLPEMLSEWDGMVSDLATIDALLQVVDGKVDAIDALLGTVETKIDTIDTEVGVIDGVVGSIDAKPQMYEIWSDNYITVTAAAAGNSTDVGTVVLPNWAGLTIRRAEIIYSVRKINNQYGGQNQITSGVLRVKKGAGAYLTGYTFINGEWDTENGVDEGQGVPPSVCDVDVKATVDAFNATYTVRADSLTCTGDFLTAVDMKIGLRLWV